jgi:enoyl-CoA hydratase
MDYDLLQIDEPAEHVRRITLNRPEKRNALSGRLRGEISNAVHESESMDDVRVTIIRGNGPSFCAGYDLSPAPGDNAPLEYGNQGQAGYQRAVVSQWTGMWDLSKPIIAQVHGHCLAGGTELVTGCDLVYVAEDAKIGYPAVRFGTPDMQYHAWLVGMRRGMELMLTGDAMTGIEAADWGYANRAFPADQLEAETLKIASRVAQIPSDILQINKRTIHRAMDYMGMRQAIFAGTEMCALATHTETFREFLDSIQNKGLTGALTDRDKAFGDGRIATHKNAQA